MGYVIETDPVAGATLPADGVVTVVISEGAVPTVVPGVIGQTPENARADPGGPRFRGRSSANRWTWSSATPTTARWPSRIPRPGQRVDFGSTVTLRVGASADTIPVPNVLGQTPAAARDAIEALDLVYAEGSPLLLDAGDADIGKVADVSPAVGTPLDPGDTVTVRIGAEGARVPDVVGACLDPSAARTAIEGAGLVYQEVRHRRHPPAGRPLRRQGGRADPGPVLHHQHPGGPGQHGAGAHRPGHGHRPRRARLDPEVTADPPPFTEYDSKSRARHRGGRLRRAQSEECQPIPAYSAYIGNLGMVATRTRWATRPAPPPCRPAPR